MFRMIEYKCFFYGKEFVKISKWFPSSKTCHKCGAIKDDLTLKDRTYKCSCGYIGDRDLNASLNIKAVGMTASMKNKADGVTSAIQSMMERKTCDTRRLSLRVSQAIPSDLIKFL